jgi:hypothetical protein
MLQLRRKGLVHVHTVSGSLHAHTRNRRNTAVLSIISNHGPIERPSAITNQTEQQGKHSLIHSTCNSLAQPEKTKTKEKKKKKKKKKDVQEEKKRKSEHMVDQTHLLYLEFKHVNALLLFSFRHDFFFLFFVDFLLQFWVSVSSFHGTSY